MGDFNAQDLANVTWAFATAGRSDVQLFEMSARMVAQRVNEFKLQEFTNTAWAFATAG